MANVRLRVLPRLLPRDGREVEFQTTATHIQWRYVADFAEYAWQNLIALAELTGEAGPTVEIRSNGTSIQYRVVGSGEDGWTDVLPLVDIKGDQGIQGVQGIQGPQGAPGPGTGDMVGPGGATDGGPIVFNGATGKLVKAGAFASQAAAEAGTDNATFMTPLRTMQTIQAQFGINQGIARWKTAQRSTRLYYGGLAQTGTGLVDGSTSAAGRTFALDKASRRIRQDGLVRTVKFTLYTLGSASLVGLLKFKVLRKSGTVYTLVSESELITPAAVTTRQTVQLATPMACQPGDVVAVWIKGFASGDPGLASAASTGDLLRFIVGETVSSTWTDIADFGIDLQFEGQPPLIVSTGDSIIDGQNTANPWQSHYGNGPAGDLNSSPMNGVRSAIAGLEYEDFAQGMSTWAGVATKTAAIAAVGASAVLAACGVNDVAAGRTWAAIKADMDTLLNGLPVGTKFFLCEVMPWSNGTDAQAVALRALNVNYAAWCVDTGATLIRTHDAMGQVRVSTGLLDDLKTSYNYDGTHLTTAGVAALAGLLATGLRSILWI